MSDVRILASAKRRLHANGFLYRNNSAIGFASRGYPPKGEFA